MAKSATETPLGAIIKGGIAGAVGTLAMDLLWYYRYRRDGGEQEFREWEFSSGTESYENAGAPAQAGKRVVEGLFEVKLDPSTAAMMNNVVHWATGIGWGINHGILVGSMARVRARLGVLTGVTAFGASYGILAPAKLYKPPWEYDAKTLWQDLSAHLVFGLTTGLTFAVLSRRR